MLVNANALQIPLADKSVQMCVTSPPYWGLRDYGVDDQLGLEPTPEQYVKNMVAVFREVKRVLRDDGVLWLNLGDSYASNYKGSGGTGEKSLIDGTETGKASRHFDPIKLDHGLKPKDLVGIPWRVALALQADGWWLRNDIIWHKTNPMPESVTDRCTKGHEHIFLLAKSEQYYYDHEAVKEPLKEQSKARLRRGNSNQHKNIGGAPGQPPHSMNEPRKNDPSRDVPSGRNRRTVWTISTKPYSGAHYAVFPPEIPEICIKAGSAPGDIVLDPFVGSGTTCMVARKLGRHSVGIDLSFDYLQNNARERLELDKIANWTSGNGKADKSELNDLPMFGGGQPEKHHKNMETPGQPPHTMHKKRL